jgi:hypothetical protein
MTLNLRVGPDGDPIRRDTRLISIVLCIVAAVLLAAACLSKRWLATGNEGQGLGYGLTTFLQCSDGACETLNNRERPSVVAEHRRYDVSQMFVPAGWATLGSSALAIVSLSICAALALFRRRLALPILPASLALLSLTAALLAGCIFIATKPSGNTVVVGVDWGFIVFAVAVVTGIIAAQRIASDIRPLDPELGEHDMMTLDRM